jgi:glycosyltransferase involved in cell wall biosynthesis
MERVLFVVNAVEFGGLEIVLLDWLSGIDYSKVSVVLCYRSDILQQKVASTGLPVETIQLSIPDGEPAWKTLQNWRRTFSSIRPQRIVLLEGNLGDLRWIPLLAARLSTRGGAFLFAGGGGPSASEISTEKRKVHFGFLPGIGLYQQREILKQRLRSRLLHHAFVSGQGLKSNLVASHRYPSERVSVLYHGVDTGRFRASLADRIEYRRLHTIPDDATVIVSHGRLAPVKRVDRTLKAFAALSAEHANLWLVLTLHGPLKQEIEKIVASNDTYRRVKLVGFQEDVSKLLKAGDFFVLSSDHEGFGIALIEAMSTGLVCVSTNCQGPSEIVADGKNGILVQATDAGILAGLRRALGLNEDERARLVERARRTVEARFELHAAICRALDSLGIPRR